MTKTRGIWSRRHSAVEDAAVRVLKDSRRPMTVREITTRMIDRGLIDVRGKTPEKTLYGLIYKKEKARREKGEKTLFKRVRKGNSVLYKLNK